jgi:acid phosphatase
MSHISRVVVIVMENQELSDVIGNPDAPYTNWLARRYGLATRYYGVAHRSLPNYLALTGGSTFGIDTDCTSCSVRATNLVDQLEQAGVSWKAYMEDMPKPCYRGASAHAYAKRHNPFMHYNDIASRRSRCSRIVPYSELYSDLRHGHMPRFSWISPNLCNDTHDCGIQAGDRFLAGAAPSLLEALGPHGVLFVVWDEGTSDSRCCGQSPGGHPPLILAGPDVRPGVRPSEPYTHYSVLRTIEEKFRLPLLRNAGCRCSQPLDAAFERRARPRQAER